MSEAHETTTITQAGSPDELAHARDLLAQYAESRMHCDGCVHFDP